MFKAVKIVCSGFFLISCLNGMEEKSPIIEDYEQEKQENLQTSVEPRKIRSLLDNCLNRVSRYLDSDEGLDYLLAKIQSGFLPSELFDKLRNEVIQDCCATIWSDCSEVERLRCYENVFEKAMALNSVAFNEYGYVVIGFLNNLNNHQFDGRMNNKAAILSKEGLIALLEGHSDEVTSVSISAGQYWEAKIATGSRDKTIRIWNLWGNCKAQLAGHEDEVTSVALTASGNYAITGSKDKTICIWKTSTGERLLRLYGHEDTVIAVAISLDGSTIASASKDKTVRVWDVSTGNCIRVLTGHTDEVTCVAVSNYGDLIFSGGGAKDKTVRCWNSRSGESISVMNHSHAVTSVALSIDSRFIISSTFDGKIAIWNIATNKKLEQFSFFCDLIRGIALAPSCHFFLSSSHDGGLCTIHIIETLFKKIYSKLSLEEFLKSIQLMRRRKDLFLAKELQDKSFYALEGVLQ